MLGTLVVKHASLNGQEPRKERWITGRSPASHTRPVPHIGIVEDVSLDDLEGQSLGGAGRTNDDEWSAELDAYDDGKHVLLQMDDSSAYMKITRITTQPNSITFRALFSAIPSSSFTLSMYSLVSASMTAVSDSGPQCVSAVSASSSASIRERASSDRRRKYTSPDARKTALR